MDGSKNSGRSTPSRGLNKQLLKKRVSPIKRKLPYILSGISALIYGGTATGAILGINELNKHKTVVTPEQKRLDDLVSSFQLQNGYTLSYLEYHNLPQTGSDQSYLDALGQLIHVAFAIPDDIQLSELTRGTAGTGSRSISFRLLLGAESRKVEINIRVLAQDYDEKVLSEFVNQFASGDTLNYRKYAEFAVSAHDSALAIVQALDQLRQTDDKPLPLAYSIPTGLEIKNFSFSKPPSANKSDTDFSLSIKFDAHLKAANSPVTLNYTVRAQTQVETDEHEQAMLALQNLSFTTRFYATYRQYQNIHNAP
ncbi:unnamed protein product [Didymodactylos carnosus]|uniref:Uncharacterized protein n=1 Tax=Didymodactylos carnosus TaxID=1234261 RepID=A0A8S2GP04_9BILA|nr:unnamed protein product [Didymodactylos carnosus]CAF3532651.1 unnamed protein product [Didymodactylos carnosus]